MAYVRGRCIDRVLPAVGAHLFSDCGDVAKLESRSASRLVGRQPLCFELRDGLLEIVLDLISDLAIGGRPIQESTKATDCLAPERHAATPRLSGCAPPPQRAGPSQRFPTRVAAGLCG